MINYQGHAVFTAKVKYRNGVAKINLIDNINLHPKIEGISSASLKFEHDGAITLNIFVEQSESPKHFEKIAKDTASHIAHAMIFEPDFHPYIQSVDFSYCQSRSTLKEIHGEKKTLTFTAGFQLTGEMNAIHNISKESIQGFIKSVENSTSLYIQKLEEGKEIKDLQMNQYRFACMQEDIISKFMILYQILLNEAEDEQSEVDKIIVGMSDHFKIECCYKESKIYKHKRHKKTSIWESIYTKLRNQLAHRRPGEDGKPINAKETYKGIASYVEKLEFLVREVIILKYKQSDGQDLLEAIKKNGEDRIKKLCN